MPDKRRQNYRRFNHPRDGAPEIGEEFQEGIGLPFFNLVRAVLRQPFLSLGLTEADAKHVGATDPSLIEDEVQQLLAMSPNAEKTDFKPGMAAGTSTKITLGDPAAIDSEIPGLNLTKLTSLQKEGLKKQLAGQQCTCGCNLTVLKCRQVDRACRVSLKMAQEQMEKVLKSGV